MAIDILNIQPSTISRDLKGKYICLYGPEKVGKTTFGAKMPRALFCNFEIGTNFLAGVKAVNIDKWATFKLVLRQLEKAEAKEMYDTVVIDTVSEAYSDCELYTCAQAGVQKLGDIPWGGGYASCKKEFESCLRKITMLGYGICLICHSEKKNLPGPNDTVIETVSPAMPSRAADVVNRLVDIIAYIDMYPDEKGNMQRRFITRQTPSVKAGSRLPYLEPVIPFSYEHLVNAIGAAVEKQVEFDGAVVSDGVMNVVDEIPSFLEIRKEASDLWMALVGNGETDEQKEHARTIMKKVEMVFGHSLKLSEITEDQKDLFYLVLLEIKDYAKLVS